MPPAFLNLALPLRKSMLKLKTPTAETGGKQRLFRCHRLRRPRHRPVDVGTKEVVTLEDGWTVVTADNKPSAHFEHSVAVMETGPVVLTCGPNGEGWAMS